VIWTFYDQVVKVETGWVEQEFVLLIISALPNETGLPSELISYRILVTVILLSSFLMGSILISVAFQLSFCQVSFSLECSSPEHHC
jgi:hypothetical protein